MTKRKLGRKRFISSYSSQATVHHWRKPWQKLKAGARRQELKQNSKQHVAYWIGPHRLLRSLAFLYHSDQEPRSSTTRVGLSLSTCNYDNAYGQFCRLRFLFPLDASRVKLMKKKKLTRAGGYFLLLHWAAMQLPLLIACYKSPKYHCQLQKRKRKKFPTITKADCSSKL